MPLWLSNSKISAYGDCPLRYAKRYIERLPASDGSRPAFIRGRAAHKGQETYLYPQIEKPDTLPLTLGEVQEAAAAEFEKGAAGISEFTEADGSKRVTEGPPVNWSEYETDKGIEKDLTLKGIVPEAYGKLWPSIPVSGVEVRAEVVLAGEGLSSVILWGFLDTLRRDNWLVDFKHSARGFAKPEEARASDQLRHYSILSRYGLMKAVAGVGFDTVQMSQHRDGTTTVRGIAQPRAPAFTDEELDLHMDRVTEVVRAIDAATTAGTFPPTTTPWACKGCDYRSTCKFSRAKEVTVGTEGA